MVSRNVNHKRSISTINGNANNNANGFGYGQLLNEKASTNALNPKNEEITSSFLKPSQNKLSTCYKTQENAYFNNNLKFAEREEQKPLFSTFTGSNNFAKELKNSPLKKAHYNIGEINSKYIQKEMSAVNFSNNDVDFLF